MRRLLPSVAQELHGPRAGRTGQEAGAPGLRASRPRCLSFWRLETHCAPPPAAGAWGCGTGKGRRLRGQGWGRGWAGPTSAPPVGRARWAWEWAGAEKAQGLGPASASGRVSAPASLLFRLSAHLKLLRVGGWGVRSGRPPGARWTAPQEERPRSCLVYLASLLLWSGLEFLHF